MLGMASITCVPVAAAQAVPKGRHTIAAAGPQVTRNAVDKGAAPKAQKQSLRVYLAPSGGQDALKAASTRCPRRAARPTAVPDARPVPRALRADGRDGQVRQAVAQAAGLKPPASSSTAATSPRPARGRGRAGVRDVPAPVHQDGQTFQAPATTATAPDSVASAMLAVSGLTTASRRWTPSTFPPPPGFVNARPCSNFYGAVPATSRPTSRRRCRSSTARPSRTRRAATSRGSCAAPMRAHAVHGKGRPSASSTRTPRRRSRRRRHLRHPPRRPGVRGRPVHPERAEVVHPRRRVRPVRAGSARRRSTSRPSTAWRRAAGRPLLRRDELPQPRHRRHAGPRRRREPRLDRLELLRGPRGQRDARRRGRQRAGVPAGRHAGDLVLLLLRRQRRRGRQLGRAAGRLPGLGPVHHGRRRHRHRHRRRPAR